MRWTPWTGRPRRWRSAGFGWIRYPGTRVDTVASLLGALGAAGKGDRVMDEIPRDETLEVLVIAHKRIYTLEEQGTALRTVADAERVYLANPTSTAYDALTDALAEGGGQGRDESRKTK